MTVRTTTYNYEQSSEGSRERHIPLPWTRLVDVTPTLHDPFCVTSREVALQMCGTVITLGVAVTDPYVIGNIAEGAIYAHNVANVCNWNATNTAADTYCQINIGDPVFYDTAADALWGYKLSLASHLGNETTPRPLFGFIVMLQTEVSGDFPKGSTSTHAPDLCAVLQAGLNSREVA